MKMRATAAFSLGALAFTALALGACAGHRTAGSLLPPAASHRKTASVGDAYSTTILGDGPTAYYRLDDATPTAADSSGNGFNGTVGSGVSESVSGLLISSNDAAMTLPGTASASGAVVVPQNTALQPASTLSMEMWLRFASTPANYTMAMAYGSDYTYAPYGFYFSSGKIVAQFYLSSGVVTVASSSALSANTTYYVAATYDGTAARLYVNGTQVATVSKSGTLTGYLAGYGLAIGDDAHFSDPAFKGTVDEVAVYAARVLSAAQVQNHYAVGTGPSSSTAPSASPSPSPTAAPTSTPVVGSDAYETAVLDDAPTAYYRLDDTGSRAADFSGNNLTGTIGSSVGKGAAGLLPSSNDTAITLPGIANASGSVIVPQTTRLQPAAAVSLEAWLRFTSVPNNYTIPVSYGSDTSYAPYCLYFNGGKIVAQFYLTSGVLLVSSPSALAANTSYYVVATFDGQAGRLYVNGAQVAAASKAGTFTGYINGYGLAIGDDAAFSDPAFHGTIDEVAIYAGKALSATSVQNHYIAATTGVPPSPSPAPSPTSTPSGGLVDWPTMGYDVYRSGYNSNESVIGIGSFGNLHKYWAAPAQVDNPMVGEPVVASGVTVNGERKNVLYAGGGDGIFHAFDADTGAAIWSKQLGEGSYSCGGGSSPFGVESAAQIDRSRNRVYVPDGTNKIHALDLSTGAEAQGWPVSIASVTGHDFIYAGLTLNPNNNMLYAETSSTCDISPWHGRISAVNAATGAVVNTFYPTQGSSGGSVWGFGGASVDPATNDVFIATGNAPGSPQNAYYAEQIVQLSADLSTVIAHNGPPLPNSPDADFGATPLLFTPPGCPALLAAVNKSGVFALYDRAGISSGPTQVIQMSIATDSGDFIGVPTYDPATNEVYIGLPATEGIYKPGVGAFSIQSNCTLNPTPVWNAVFGPDGAAAPSDDTPRSPITIAHGVAYVSGYSDDTVHAFNAATGAALWSAPLGGYGIVGPIVVNGHLYVGDMSGEIQAWTP